MLALISVALGVAACSGGDHRSPKADGSASTTSTSGSAGGPAVPTVAGGTKAIAAGADALSWDVAAATAANGPMPSASPTTVCGADDRRFLGELLWGANPLDYKIPKRLADIKASPSMVMVSGTIVDPSLGTGDFPFDHTTGSDFNADVKLDAPFHGVGQEQARAIDTVHIELAEGQLPHLAAPPLPVEGTWPAMSENSRRNLQDPFVPHAGDRVLVMGNWIVDCGHTDFQTEIHPITFMAVARTEGNATVVHTFYNPWRETQLYNPDPAKAIDFARPDRIADPTNVPFPKGMIDSILRLQGAGPAPQTSADRLASWAVLEPNIISPVDWTVCPPGTAPGTAETRSTRVGTEVVTRPGVDMTVIPGGGGCATVRTSLAEMIPGAPAPKVCTTPWDFLSTAATEAVQGEEKQGEKAAKGTAAPIDLKAELGRFVQPQFRTKLDADPVMNCYDPLSAPDLGSARPASIRVSSDPVALLPLVGTIVARRTG